MTAREPHEIATITVLSDYTVTIEGANIASDRDTIINALEKMLAWLCSHDDAEHAA